jgi:hypothetical protein
MIGRRLILALDILTGESESERQNWPVILTRHPTLPQRTPTDQRTPERQEGFVDVGPLVIPHAQAPKLTEPGKCALHDPSPPAQANPVAQSGSDPTRPPVASRASDASTSPPTRTRVPAGASARPVRHARSETRGRPPCGRRAGIGKNGSTRSHKGSGSSAAAMPVHATSPTTMLGGFVTRSF